LTPTVVLIETVNRLAARVNTSRTNHDKRPALVKKGSLTVEVRAEHRSKNPTVEMPTKRRVLFQFLFSIIIGLSLVA
jgi:hypothetical protein